jgi:hypothetical protein
VLDVDNGNFKVVCATAAALYAIPLAIGWIFT